MDGQKQWQVVPRPRFLQPQRVEIDEKVSEKECVKLTKVRRRGYVMMGEVKSLTHYFSLPKRKDIRMLYNRTLSGINSSLSTPHFALPSVGSTLWSVDRGVFMVDRDIG